LSALCEQLPGLEPLGLLHHRHQQIHIQQRRTRLFAQLAQAQQQQRISKTYAWCCV